MNKQLLIASSLLLALLLSACSSGGTPAQIDPTSTPSETATQSPTSTSMLAPTPSPTPAGTPAQIDPTSTPSKPATQTQSPTSTSAPAPSPTPAATPTSTQTPPTTSIPSPTPLPTGPIPSIAVEPAFPGLPFATFGDNTLLLAYPPDESNRVVVVEQEGFVSIFANSPQTGQVTKFLDISAKVSTRGKEEGLLGLAFHPNYSTNGYFYVYYSAANPRRSVLSRFTVSANPDLADPGSELILLEVPQPYSNHNGGALVFGPDGYLYVGLGDGGSGGDPTGNGQNPATLLGSILRIDVDNPAGSGNYGIPPDNPFASSASGTRDPRPEIWAYGLRNPWRFSFDRATGDLWVGDVGQNAWEEIDVIERGGNYGWNILEGTHCFKPASNCDTAGTILPVAEYDHGRGSCSVTGGHVYRGPAMPELSGVYIYADFCSGLIWGVRANDRAAGAQLIGGGLKWITSFGEDAEGNLYMLVSGGPPLRITLAE